MTLLLDGWLATRPDVRLVIIDMLARLLGSRPANSNVYLEDSLAVAKIQLMAQRHYVAIVVVHHLRKAPAPGDPFDAVSGSLGLTGSADSTLIMLRQWNRAKARMIMTGHDVEEKILALRFDAGTCRWAHLGDADSVQFGEERQAVLNLLAEADEPMSSKQIAEALGKKDGAVRKLLGQMLKEGQLLRPERGKYAPGAMWCNKATSTSESPVYWITDGVAWDLTSGNNGKVGNNGSQLGFEDCYFVTEEGHSSVTSEKALGAGSQTDCYLVTDEFVGEEIEI